MTQKSQKMVEAQDRVDNAHAVVRTLAEAVVALSILTGSGDAEIDQIAEKLASKLDAAKAEREMASTALQAARR